MRRVPRYPDETELLEPLLGAAFWEEWDEEGTPGDLDPVPDLAGAELGEVEAARFGRQGARLRIGLAGGAVWLSPPGLPSRPPRPAAS